MDGKRQNLGPEPLDSDVTDPQHPVQISTAPSVGGKECSNSHKPAGMVCVYLSH